MKRTTRYPRGASLSVVLLAATLWGGVAMADDPPPPEELRVVMARRLAALTGLPWRIEALQFNPFTGAFTGRGVRAGPAKRPLLRVARFSLKIGLLGQARGKVEAAASGVAAGGLEVAEASLAGALSGAGLRIQRMRASGPGGEASGAGKIALADGRVGAVALAGEAVLRPSGEPDGPALEGKWRLRGKGLKRLMLSGRLSGDAVLPRGKGSLGAPAGVRVRIKVKLGKRRVTGSLRRWRVR